MNYRKTFGIMCCVVALGALIFALTTQADQWNKKTILTINETLQIPGATLTPGKYVFKLMDSPANRHIVQVFNEDETQLITTILAIPNYRLRPTGETEFGFWEMPQGSPPALRAWFYPGDNFGQEFAYPKTEATKIAAATNEQVQSIPDQSTAEQLKTTPVTPEGKAREESTQTSSTNQPATEPAPAAPAAPVTQPEPTPSTTAPTTQPAPAPSTAESRTEPAQREVAVAPEASRGAALPGTASVFPLVGLMGFFSVGIALILRVIRQYLS